MHALQESDEVRQDWCDAHVLGIRTELSASEIERHLRRMRSQAAGGSNVGSHQLDAHWSLAYACEQPSESWEIYRSASLHSMPCTSFFIGHPEEIQEALKPNATWELLRDHAVEKLRLDAGLTQTELSKHGGGWTVVFYDDEADRWIRTDVPQVRWFDSRELTRKLLAENKEELDYQLRVESRIARLREWAQKYPTEKRIKDAAKHERHIREECQAVIRSIREHCAADHAWLAKLDQTRDFKKSLFGLLRAAENEVRAARGVCAVGEAWVSEIDLLYRIRNLFPEVAVLSHGQPQWLGRQHLDIWIPSKSVAIEYHGPQHFEPVDFFGGEAAFRRTQERDRRKRALCEANGVRLIEIAYDRELGDAELVRLISAD